MAKQLTAEQQDEKDDRHYFNKVDGLARQKSDSHQFRIRHKKILEADTRSNKFRRASFIASLNAGSVLRVDDFWCREDSADAYRELSYVLSRYINPLPVLYYNYDTWAAEALEFDASKALEATSPSNLSWVAYAIGRSLKYATRYSGVKRIRSDIYTYEKVGLTPRKWISDASKLGSIPHPYKRKEI